MRSRYSGQYSLVAVLVSFILQQGCTQVFNQIDTEVEFQIEEEEPVGTVVGNIVGRLNSSERSFQFQLPFLGVHFPSGSDEYLDVNKFSGEIKTKSVLDHEDIEELTFIAFSLNSVPLKVIVHIIDINDNAPRFPVDVTSISISESAQRNHKESLAPARDIDSGVYTVQLYELAAGNLNETFRLGTRRKNGVLYPDLEINGKLDRETVPNYKLTLVAYDGGNPPKMGTMTINVIVVDVNDNQPMFSQSSYSATLPENTTVGTSILHVEATDADDGDNGNIIYSINRRQSDPDSVFVIDPKTAVLSLNKLLDYKNKEEYLLIVQAADKGVPSLVSSAYITVKISSVKNHQPNIDFVFTTEDGTNRVQESTAAESVIARISVSDPDNQEEKLTNVNVTLEGGNEKFHLKTDDRSTYWMYLGEPLDREETDQYNLTIIASDSAKIPLRSLLTVSITVLDSNDNAPRFTQKEYEASIEESSEIGAFVIQVHAHDIDLGANAEIVYSISSTKGTGSEWFTIDKNTGLITTKGKPDCLVDPHSEIIVTATDQGTPALSSTASVQVAVVDVNDHEPQFSLSFYNVSVSEGEKTGKCIMKVSVSKPDIFTCCTSLDICYKCIITSVKPCHN